MTILDILNIDVNKGTNFSETMRSCLFIFYQYYA